MATTRRSHAKTAPRDTSRTVFIGDDNIIPGEVVLTLVPSAVDSMTASVPLHPARSTARLAGTLGVDELDTVLTDLDAYDITRLALPAHGLGEAGLVAEAAAEHQDVLARTFRVRIGANHDVEKAVATLSSLANVELAEPNRYRQTYATPNDPRYAEQWGLPKINAPAAWDRTTGAASIVVAVVDTGADLTHPDLVAQLVPGYDMVDLGPKPTPPTGWRFEGDFSGRDATPTDEVGHGTHVAGTIAAASNNAVGVAGVAWSCKIMPVKALTRRVRISDGRVDGVGSSVDIAAAIRWAVDHGASVINLSLGSASPTSVESSAVAYAITSGVVVVAAMGNDGTSNPSYPAAYPDVIAVGAVDSTDQLASFSQTGPHIDLVAPGVDILSTFIGGYGSMDGTSMAAPHVAGVAALIRSVKPAATVAEVTDILHTTAHPLRKAAGDPVPNDFFGHGLLDAAAAVAKAVPIVLANTRFIVHCLPRTPRQKFCPPTTVLKLECMPHTVSERECVKTVFEPRCQPIPITITRTPLTTNVWQLGGYGAGSAYDPYGYLAAATSQPEASGYEVGFQDGYAAAIAELQAAIGDQEAPTEDANAAPTAVTEDLSLHTIQPLQCGPFRTLQCWPRTVPWRDCPPPTVLQSQCIPPTVLEPQCLPRTLPTTDITINPTTPQVRTLRPGGFGTAADPYGYTPFQG